MIKANRFGKICDFGCGDGEYIRLLKKTQREELYFHGVDASSSMIHRARQQLCCDDVDFEVSEDGIKKEETFDMVYSSAVWAHIDDGLCPGLLKTVYDRLRGGGVFVICEQTAPFRFGGGTFVRRPCEEYCSYLTAAGFSILNVEIIDFWLHRLLVEKRFAKWLRRRKKYASLSSEQARIELNRSRFFRAVSSVCTLLSVPRVFRGRSDTGEIRNRWGYCFITAVRKEA